MTDETEETPPQNASGFRLEPVKTFRVEVIDGPDRGAHVTSKNGCVIAGRSDGVTLRLNDRTVSQFHLELLATDGGVRARDLGSSNGTLFHGAAVRDVVLRAPAELALGKTTLRVTPGGHDEVVLASTATRFHDLIGASPAMRAVYTRLQSAAVTSSTVLLLGESGTGKELAVRALHLASPRAGEHLEVINCGGLPSTLVESELFGHVRGAFTGAHRDKEGAFERAHGGTIFLDEVGELPLESQPKLLRVLETGQIQRVGDDRVRKVDVRVVAATHRDLRADVNAGRFRADLYYRLAVITVHMPPLRERLEDLGSLAETLIARIRRERGIAGDLSVDGVLLAALREHTWPGNVRELRNYLEQWLVLNQQPEYAERGDSEAPPKDLVRAVAPLCGRPLREVRDEFERAYLLGLLERCKWQVVEAARTAGIDRVTLFRMMRRHQIERSG